MPHAIRMQTFVNTNSHAHFDPCAHTQTHRHTHRVLTNSYMHYLFCSNEAKLLNWNSFAFASAIFSSVNERRMKEEDRKKKTKRNETSTHIHVSFYRRLFLVSTTVRSHTATAKHWAFSLSLSVYLSVYTKFPRCAKCFILIRYYYHRP